MRYRTQILRRLHAIMEADVLYAEQYSITEREHWEPASGCKKIKEDSACGAGKQAERDFLRRVPL